MGCISIDISRIGIPLYCTAGRVGESMYISSQKMGGALIVTCSLVCTTGRDFYVKVVQDEIWLTPNDALIDVQSNTSWYIE